jgi:uncharacterized protein (DUF952 family)
MELHHVLSTHAWDAAQAAGEHAPPNLARDGFLHCCTPAQLGFVLRRHFAGVTGLVILTFDSDAVPAAIEWVTSEPDQDPFPHLYGPIPCTAVRHIATP